MGSQTSQLLKTHEASGEDLDSAKRSLNSRLTPATLGVKRHYWPLSIKEHRLQQPQGCHDADASESAHFLASARAPSPSGDATSVNIVRDGEAPANQQSRLLYPTAAPMPAPVTVPCQYRTGKTLGSGTYAVVKEAIHIKTGKYYACKVINKKLMEGREYMVRNEISVLKRVSSGHLNIVTLHDYFETAHNLYLCFDLCTGGELFDRICAKGNYSEPDAAGLVRTILKAVKYIHDCGIVHRDLKPENLLFRTPAEDADIMIADFGLSRVMDEQKLSMLTEICGTPGYMAPEIFKRTGHGKPVDIWAMGVVTYFLLAGYTPFDRDTQQQEMDAIIAGDYKFEPQEYWAHVSNTGREFVKACLTVDVAKRPTAAEALEREWLAAEKPHFVPDPASATGEPTNLLPHIQKHFDARKTFRKAVFGMMAMRRMSSLVAHHDSANVASAVAQYKEESAKEIMEDTGVVHHHNSEHPGSPPLSPNPLAQGALVSPDSDSTARKRISGAGAVTEALAGASLIDHKDGKGRKA